MCANGNPHIITLLSVGKIYFVIKEIVKIAAAQPQSCERNNYWEVCWGLLILKKLQLLLAMPWTTLMLFSCLATSYMHQYLDGCMLHVYLFLKTCISASTDCNHPTVSDYFIYFHGQSTSKYVHCSRMLQRWMPYSVFLCFSCIVLSLGKER